MSALLLLGKKNGVLTINSVLDLVKMQSEIIGERGCAACKSANVQREGQGRWAEAAGSELAKVQTSSQAGSHGSLVASGNEG